MNVSWNLFNRVYQHTRNHILFEQPAPSTLKCFLNNINIVISMSWDFLQYSINWRCGKTQALITRAHSFLRTMEFEPSRRIRVLTVEFQVETWNSCFCVIELLKSAVETVCPTHYALHRFEQHPTLTCVMRDNLHQMWTHAGDQFNTICTKAPELWLAIFAEVSIPRMHETLACVMRDNALTLACVMPWLMKDYTRDFRIGR